MNNNQKIYLGLGLVGIGAFLLYRKSRTRGFLLGDGVGSTVQTQPRVSTIDTGGDTPTIGGGLGTPTPPRQTGVEIPEPPIQLPPRTFPVEIPEPTPQPPTPPPPPPQPEPPIPEPPRQRVTDICVDDPELVQAYLTDCMFTGQSLNDCCRKIGGIVVNNICYCPQDAPTDTGGGGTGTDTGGGTGTGTDTGTGDTGYDYDTGGGTGDYGGYDDDIEQPPYDTGTGGSGGTGGTGGSNILVLDPNSTIVLPPSASVVSEGGYGYSGGGGFSGGGYSGGGGGYSGGESATEETEKTENKFDYIPYILAGITTALAIVQEQ